jgi:beta-lactamase regulating signal transducer with metallopeptidase domain
MTILVEWLLQGSAIAAVTALGLRCLPRLNAATRHAIWWLALVAVVLVPLAQVGRSSSTVTGSNVSARLMPATILPAIPDRVIAGLVVVWLSAVLLSAIRTATSLQQLVRLKRQSAPFEPARERRLPMWTSVRGAGRRSELRVANVPGGAGALGLWRPIIAVSPRLAARMDDEALDQIVMHEHAHLARRDDWLRLAQAVVGSVAGLHPAVWFINRQIDLEREAACDDRVVSRTGALRRYAVCLADAATIAGGSFERGVIPTAAGARPGLTTRVQRLLESRHPHTTGLSRVGCSASAVLLVGVVAAATTLGPAVGFRQPVGALPALAVLTWPDRATVSQRAAERDLAGDRARAGSAPGGRPTPSRVRRRQAAPIPPAPVAAATAEQTSAPSPTASQAAVITPAPDVLPLEGRRLEPSGAAIVPSLTRPPAPQTTGSAVRETQWTRAADAGVEVGARAKRSGLAIGNFFTRTSKRIASSFADPPEP